MHSIINVKVDRVIKKKAQTVAKELGFSLSGIVNAYLRQFIRSGSLFVSARFEEPSQFLQAAIQEAEKEKKKKMVKSFNSAEKAAEYLDKIIARKI